MPVPIDLGFTAAFPMETAELYRHFADRDTVERQWLVLIFNISSSACLRFSVFFRCYKMIIWVGADGLHRLPAALRCFKWNRRPTGLLHLR